MLDWSKLLLEVVQKNGGNLNNIFRNSSTPSANSLANLHNVKRELRLFRRNDVPNVPKMIGSGMRSACARRTNALKNVPSAQRS